MIGPELRGERALSGGSRILAGLFFALQFANLARQVLIRNFGAEWNVIGFACNVASIGVFALFLWSIRNVDRPGLLSGLPVLGRFWWRAVAGLVAAGVLLGAAVHRYPAKFVALDAVPYFFILGMAVVGSKPTAFHHLVRLLLGLLFVAIPLNLYALTDIGQLAAQAAAGDRFGVDSLAYETQVTLGAWPLLLLVSNSLKKWRAILVFSSVLLYTGMMVLFQKRLGSAIVLLVVALYVHQSLHARNYRIGGSVTAGRHYLREFGVVVCVGLVAVLIGGRGILAEQAQALMGRLAAQDNSEYSGGALSVFSLENERIQVVYECFASFDRHEWLFGRGMGGAFEWTSFNANLLATDRAESVISQYFLPDLGYFGRREFEIGMLMPLLKGGLLLFGTFFTGVLGVLLHPGQVRKDYFSSAAYYTLLYVAVFLLHGGGFILADSLTLVVWGLAIGRCLFALGAAGPGVPPFPRPLRAGRAAP